MTLPSSGTITLDQIHVEAGGSTGTQCSINDADIRSLISASAGSTMSFSDFYGASSAPESPQTRTVTVSSQGGGAYGGAGVATAYDGRIAYGTAPADFFEFNKVIPGARILEVKKYNFPQSGSPQVQVFFDKAYGDPTAALPNLRMQVSGGGKTTGLIPLSRTLTGARFDGYSEGLIYFNSSVSPSQGTNAWIVTNSYIEQTDADQLWRSDSVPASNNSQWEITFTWGDARLYGFVSQGQQTSQYAGAYGYSEVYGVQEGSFGSISPTPARFVDGNGMTHEIYGLMRVGATGNYDALEFQIKRDVVNTPNLFRGLQIDLNGTMYTFSRSLAEANYNYLTNTTTFKWTTNDGFWPSGSKATSDLYAQFPVNSGGKMTQFNVF